MPDSARASSWSSVVRVPFAAWASRQVTDTNSIVRRFLPIWQPLGPDERKELVDMALEIAEVGGAPTDAQSLAIRRLSEGLLAR